MPTNFDLAEAAINFTAGTEATWNAFVLPIPENVVVYTVDTKKFKKGDGNHRFSELEDGPSIAGIASGEETVVNVLTQLEAGDEDSIIAISNEIYDASATKLNDLIARLNILANSNTVQTANMDAADLQFGLVNNTITNSDNGKLAVVIGHDMSAGVLPDTLSVQAPVNPINIRSIKFYDDSNLKNEVTRLYGNNVYYCNANVQHDTADVDNITITLDDDKNYITTEHIARGIFKLTLGEAPYDETASFTVTGTYNTDTITVSKDISIIKEHTILVGVYGGNGRDTFNSVTVDSAGNIVCCGFTTSEHSSSYYQAIVIKFDSNMNIIAKKKYGGDRSSDLFNMHAIDSNDNIVCVGYGYSEQLGYEDAYIVKFDSNLNVIAKKYYGGTVGDIFWGVTIDSSNNIFCAGNTNSEFVSTPSETSVGLIVKFDSSLNILTRKVYGSTTGHVQIRGCTTDSQNNVICCGLTVEGTIAGYHNCFVIKFDNSLNILARKYTGRATSSECFYRVATDSQNNIICCGLTTVIASNLTQAVIVKFDSSLNVIVKKYTSDRSILRDIVIDSSDNIVCVGNISSIDPFSDGAIVKFNSNLDVLGVKTVSSDSTYDTFMGVTIDQNGRILAAGATNVEYDKAESLIVRFPESIPAGIFTGTILSRLKINDMIVSVNDINFTSSNSALTLANSTLTLANSTLTLANSNLAFTLDKIY